jgi:hypothetical protein
MIRRVFAPETLKPGTLKIKENNGMRYMSGLFCGLLVLMCVGQSPLHSLQGLEKKPGAPPPENSVRYFAGIGTEGSGGKGINALIPLLNVFGQVGIALDFVPRIFGFDLFADAGLGGGVNSDGLGMSFNAGAQADFRFLDTLSLGFGGGINYQVMDNDDSNFSVNYMRFSCSILIWRHYAQGCNCNEAIRIGVYYDILNSTNFTGSRDRFGIKVSYTWFY